jgi:Synergist-CTERM protein sorting domain-containing protein
MDIVVDTNFSDQVIALGNGENSITSGDTTIVAGVLSIAGAGSVGPETIRVGTPEGTAAHPGYRDFRNVNGSIATLHADGSFAVDKPVITDSRGSNVAANLSANRGDTVSYSDVTVNGTAGGNLGRTNLVINNDFSTNTGNNAAGVGNYSWGAPRYMAGTVAFSDKYAFAGTITNPTRVDIERGVLHLEKTPESGFALANVFDPWNALSNGAILSFGKDANDFSKSLDLVTVDDSRVRVVLRASDLKDTLGAAQTSDAVLKVATFTNNLGRNAINDPENRLVFQIDLKEVSTLPGGKYVKLFETLDSTDWNSLHWSRESSTGATEDYAKIDLAFVNTTKSEQENSLQRSQIEAYLGEHEYAVYLIIKDTIDPDLPAEPGPTDPVTATPDYTALTLTASVRDASVANKEVTFTLEPVTAGAAATLTETATADAQGYAGPVTFSNLAKVQYRLTVTDPDGVTVGSARTFDFSQGGGSSPVGTGGSSGGCDAGFGAFALLAATGAVTLIRRKH